MTTEWSADDVPPLDDRRVVVTGANSGLGLEATRIFAERGADVIMACRSTERGERAAAEIRQEAPAGSLDVRECDLADLDSAERFAESVRADHGALDVLCNNAGLMAIPRGETAQGFETQFGVNHLGHFALTGHLLPALLEAEDARIVTQASGMHERGEITVADVEADRLADREKYDRWDVYGDSKLANVLFAYELQRRLDDAGTETVRSVACHPGWAATNLQSRAAEGYGSRLVSLGMRAANAVFAQSATQGALPMVYAAVEDVEGGSYVGPGGLMNMRGAPEIQRSSDRSYDRRVAEALWRYSIEKTGVEYPLQMAATA